jgi:Family of unknown function (DUF6113)
VRLLAHAGLTVAAVLIGAVVGVLALGVHRDGGSGRPWGLLLAVAGSAAASVVLSAVSDSRGAVLGYGLGWGAVVLVALAGRPEGDYLVAADVLGWGFVLAGCGAVVIVTAVGLLRPRAAPDLCASDRRMASP